MARPTISQRIALEGGAGPGATFSFTLPLAAASQPASPVHA